MSSLREKYICKRPFEYSEIEEDSHFICCPSWLPENIKTSNSPTVDFFSQKADLIRDSVKNGSYKFCNSVLCPHLSKLDKGQVDSTVFIPKDSNLNLKPTLKYVSLGYDKSCNLYCPSCRPHLINYKEGKRKKVEDSLTSFISNASEDIESLILCGNGDPFFSKTYLNFMSSFNSYSFPKLRYVHLHTNALLWTPQVWKRVSAIHPYVKSFEISIDAATQETYEKKVRLGGNWNKLIENLKFISTLTSIKRRKFSFVVQKNNYREMKDFYSLITSMFKGKNIEILFIGITDWGSLTQQEFKDQEVHNPNHPEHTKFLKELEKIVNLNIEHNFHHLLTRQKTVI